MKAQYLSAMQQAWSRCEACQLCQTRTNVVFGYGNPDAQVMIVGEAPGENEDRSGRPFVGQAGMLLDQYLSQVSARDDVISTAEELSSIKGKSAAAEQRRNECRILLRDLLVQEFYFTNVVMCRPTDEEGGNRDPIPKEIEACRSRLLEQIYTVDPVIIIAAGRIASEALIGKKLSITSARGEIFDVEFRGRGLDIKYPVLAILHPSYLLRRNDFNQTGGEGEKTYYDLLRAMKIVDEYNKRHFGIPLPKRRPRRG